jgi:hypothetical protein
LKITITKGYHDVPANPVIIESAIVENDNQQSNSATSGNNENQIFLIKCRLPYLPKTTQTYITNLIVLN